MSARIDQPTDHTGLRVLGLDECLERLGRVPVGRLAFVLDGEVTVLPVAHLVDGVDVCFRTAGSSKLETAVDHDRVAYEADQFDEETRAGWSVLVQGTATFVDADDVRRLDERATRPWVPDQEGASTWVRVRTQSVSGRELV